MSQSKLEKVVSGSWLVLGSVMLAPIPMVSIPMFVAGWYQIAKAK